MRILLISLILSSNSYAVCKNWKTSYFYGGVKKYKEVHFCFDGHHAFSEVCKKKESCSILNRLKESNLELFKKENSQVGSRGFGLCYKIGAKPSIFRVTELKDKMIAKCEFEGEFVDTEMLQVWEKEISQ